MVLNTQLVDLRLQLRALGVRAPAKLLRALRSDARFASWQHTIVNGEIHAEVVCHAVRPSGEDVAAWFAAASATAPNSAYR